ncbi:hypothetical protein [Bradyrhizobium sp. 150]|uniref:hypothetical protein n=1 Tax=Bradyrhizobium sp. 150 TaxID=2782625 RepID=UPI001FFA8A96|nr:hypothetical protein [Bradyrhizobium sp. 150]MCK1672589.1 hypothetical protein [Bradyrhizobium sp. 150]
MQDIEANIARLIRSVEPRFRPSSVNEKALAEAARWCLDWFGDAKKYSTGSHEAARRRLYQDALPIARKLANLLNNEVLWDDRHKRRPVKTSGDIAQDLLCCLQGERDAAFASYEDLYIESFKDWTPFERLFGDYLPAVFVAAGFLGGDTIQERATKHGPYIGFAMSFAHLFGIEQTKSTPYSVNSFVKAAKRPLVVDVRKRRKVGPHRLLAPGFFESWHQGRCDDLRRLFRASSG